MTTEDAQSLLSVRALATAELLCASYVRHKPYHYKGYYACVRCWTTASMWEGWVSRAEVLVEKRARSVS